MKMLIKFGLSIALRLPENEEEIFGEKDLFHSIALACGSMANIDGVLTINEFLAFAETADKLASLYKNPLLLRVLMLKGALDQNLDFSSTLNSIKKLIRKAPKENYNDIFLSLIPLLRCQGINYRKLAYKWGTAGAHS